MQGFDTFRPRYSYRLPARCAGLAVRGGSAQCGRDRVSQAPPGSGYVQSIVATEVQLCAAPREERSLRRRNCWGLRHCVLQPQLHQDLVRAVNKVDRQHAPMLSNRAPPVRALIRERERGTIEHLAGDARDAPVRDHGQQRCGRWAWWCSAPACFLIDRGARLAGVGAGRLAAAVCNRGCCICFAPLAGSSWAPRSVRWASSGCCDDWCCLHCRCFSRRCHPTREHAELVRHRDAGGTEYPLRLMLAQGILFRAHVLGGWPQFLALLADRFVFFGVAMPRFRSSITAMAEWGSGFAVTRAASIYDPAQPIPHQASRFAGTRARVWRRSGTGANES